MCAQPVLLNDNSNGREAGSYRASYFGYTLCQKWLLCDPLDPSFESGPPVQTSQKMSLFLLEDLRLHHPIPSEKSSTAGLLNGGDQNLSLFPTENSLAPMKMCILFLPWSALNTRSIDRVCLYLATSGSVLSHSLGHWRIYINKRAHIRGSSWTQICPKVICCEHLGRETTLLKKYVYSAGCTWNMHAKVV